MDETVTHDEPEIVADEAKPVEEELAAFGIVKSTTSGRIRLQLKPDFRTPEAMAKIKAQLETNPQVQEVTTNVRTGSIIVKYSSQHSGHSLLWKAIQEAELVGDAAFDLPEDEEGEQEGGGGGGGTYGKLDQQAADNQRLVADHLGAEPHARQDPPCDGRGGPDSRDGLQPAL